MKANSLYQIHDNVAQTCLGPMIATGHQAAAIRIFTDLLKDEKTSVGAHPLDHDLLYVGTQDTETAEILGINPPQIVLSGRAWLDIQTRQQTPAGE